jgi:hypothetical protein
MTNSFIIPFYKTKKGASFLTPLIVGLIYALTFFWILITKLVNAVICFLSEAIIVATSSDNLATASAATFACSVAASAAFEAAIAASVAALAAAAASSEALDAGLDTLAVAVTTT